MPEALWSVMMKKFPVIVLLAGALALGPVGCTNMTRTQQGALSGAAGGALIGGGLGALAGGIYGHQQERHDYGGHGHRW